MLSARAIALQGIGYVPDVLARQGFWLDEAPVPPFSLRPVGGGPGGGIDRWSQKHLPKRRTLAYNRGLLIQNDRDVTEFLMALVTKGFFDGN